MSERYDHAKVEKKWQKAWEESHAFAAKENSQKKKFYPLVEFPYPSGEGLHTGHVRSYTAMDVIARKRRAQGEEVLYPIGWDAFGLPTENYAIKTGIAPAEVTKQNTDTFRRQLKSIGLSFDWDREVNTTDPKYYRWTQWIFLQLYKKGLAYKAKTAINWCPKDKIGLANEEVVDGKCERCGTPVEKREKEQWMLAITKYAQRLYDDLDTVDYIERAKVQQRNWIGPSEGAEIDFELDFKKNPADNERRGPDGTKAHLTVFTTRADTLFGATFLVLAPEHLWVKLATDAEHDVLENKEGVLRYLAAVKKKSEIERTAEGKEKTGIELKGVKAINPANGEEIPLFVADYVLSGYGTGAIMAVPAHDERDFAFAKKFDVPIRQVIMPSLVDDSNPPQEGKENTFRNSVLAIVYDPKPKKYLTLKWNTQKWTGFITGGAEEGENRADAAKREIAEETGYTNVRLVRSLGMTEAFFYAGHKGVNRKTHAEHFLFELVDDTQVSVSDEEKNQHTVQWLSSDEIEKTHMQHAEFSFLWNRIKTRNDFYTGTGILTNSGQFDGLDSEEAKKKITEFVKGKLVTTYKLRDWVFSRQRYWGEPIPMIHCAACGWQPVPEQDLPVLLPEVQKYQPTDTGESPLANIKAFVDTVCPKCGSEAKRETDVMPNWAGSSWYWLRYCDPKNDKAFAAMNILKYWTPVDWYNGGMEHTVLHLLYSRFWHKFLFDEGLVPTPEPYAKRTSHGLILAGDGTKMSKSKGNVVNPDSLVESVGADSLRLYEMFMGPFEQAIAWNTDGVVGMRRFLERVWNLSEKAAAVPMDGATESLLHQTIQKVSDDIESLKMNTAVSALMVLSNHLHDLPKIPKDAYGAFLLLLAPFAPHIASELAEKIGLDMQKSGWPQFDPAKVRAPVAQVAVQVNGRVRATLSLAPDLPESEALAAARSDAQVAKWLAEGREVRAVYVPGKVINFVTTLPQSGI